MSINQPFEPLLSICIPAYNRPHWLRRALLSIFTTPIAQHAQVEIIVSDDSTTPDCKKVVDELSTNWQGRWCYHANLVGLGMAGNWNHCIQMASGSYVLVLHDDDYLEAEAPSKILQTLKENLDSSALLFGVNVVTPQQKVRKQQIATRQVHLGSEAALKRILTNSSFIRFPGIVLKREIFAEVGYFDESIGGIADIHMWVRVCHRYGLLCIPLIVANYTVHPDALTMEMFNFQTVRKLEDMFEEVQSQEWLSEKDLAECKTNYFYQFILAGTVRYMRVWNIKRAQEVFSLLTTIDVQHAQAAAKWKMIAAILGFLLYTKGYSIKSLENKQ